MVASCMELAIVSGMLMLVWFDVLLPEQFKLERSKNIITKKI